MLVFHFQVAVITGPRGTGRFDACDFYLQVSVTTDHRQFLLDSSIELLLVVIL
jgi:hypothetical protein